MKLGRPTLIKIKPNNQEKTEFRFLLSFPESPRQVEFEASANGLMNLMVGLQRLQALHKIPIPQRVRPAVRKPHLRVGKSVV